MLRIKVLHQKAVDTSTSRQSYRLDENNATKEYGAMQRIPHPHPMILWLPDMPSGLRAGIDTLSRATEHFLMVVHRYEMYLALAGNPAFVTRINMTTCAAGLNTIRGSLAATLVVSLAALFDQDPRATSLARALNAVLTRANTDIIAALQPKFDPLIDTDRALIGLRQLRSRLSREPLQGAIGRLRDLRHQDVAHLDTSPSFPNGTALTGDMNRVYAFSASIIVKVNRFCGLTVRTRDVRTEARSQALALCASIQPQLE